MQYKWDTGQSIEGNKLISAGDSQSIDAFGRWRVSNPTTVFDSKNIFDDPGLASNVENLPLFFDNQETSGSGTSTTYNANQASQDIAVSNTTAGTRVRQTKMRFNYFPGKSQLVLMTFNMNDTAANITKRIGQFDADNGLFLEFDGTTVNLVRRTNVTGSAVDNEVAQASWNIDTMDGTGISGFTLDWTKTQIFIFDYEWLGTGRARMGFVINGIPYYVHEFNNANVLDKVYMSTPNLPIRAEITNDGSGAADSITQICCSVISEGGMEDLGILRYISTGGTHLDAATENTIYAVLGIQLKSEYLGATVKIVDLNIAEHTGSKDFEWLWILNPDVESTFNYSNNVANSAIQYAIGATANTVTNGTILNGGFASSAQRGGESTAKQVENSLRLGSLIDGTQDKLVLCVRPVAGSTNIDVEGSITWRELT